MIKLVFAVVAVLFLAGSDGCSKGRTKTSANTQAMRLFGTPAVCDGSEADGWTCFDGRGHSVWCPGGRKEEPCVLQPIYTGNAEDPCRR